MNLLQAHRSRNCSASGTPFSPLFFPCGQTARVWLIAWALALAPALASAAGRESGGYEVIANAYGFSCDIPGCPDASKNIREIAIDELNIDAREMTTGLDVDYRLYGPGQAHWGNASLTVAADSSGSKELQAWFQESAAKGNNIRKNITVTLFKSDKTPGRSYTLFDCFPTQWSSVDFDPSGTVQTETLTVKIGRIEFKTRIAPRPRGGRGEPPTPPDAILADDTSDKFAQVRGFKVEISGSSGREVDTAWESVSGGEMIIELSETTIGSDRFRTSSPGHKTVNEVTLRGAMTDGRKNLCTWINDTVNGKPWKQNLTITEMLSVDGGVKDGKQYSGIWAYPVRYKFPVLSVDQREGNFEEEITYRWVRLIPELPPRVRGLVEIPGAPVASRSAVAIGIEDMALDVSQVAVTGDARTPSAVIVVPQGAGGELADWLSKVQSGAEDRRTLLVALLRRGRPTGQIWVLHDCLPTRMSVTNTTGNTMEEVTVKPIRVELK